ncbi:MAG: hypothetical protein IJQ14_06240 [Bacteroidales bacterium]|nr:hypothetical protein [Bacteroidales bacterium]
MINEEQFEQLWEKAGAEPYATKLAAEYPAWRVRRRRTMGIAAAVLLVVGISLPMLQNNNGLNDNYLMAYCNQSDVDTEYWVNMADELLLNA